jgi:glutathione S-transferase
MATHISLIEAGVTFELARLDRKNRIFSDGEPLDKVNSKGYVPVLELQGGQFLTENVAVLLYVADLNPAARLAPAPGATLERYRLLEWLAFISSEIHKGFSPLFHREATEALRIYAMGNLSRRLQWLDGQIGEAQYLNGDGFTVADAYLFTVLSWTNAVKIELATWPNVQRYYTQLSARPAVVAAMKAEKLIK